MCPLQRLKTFASTLNFALGGLGTGDAESPKVPYVLRDNVSSTYIVNCNNDKDYKVR